MVNKQLLRVAATSADILAGYLRPRTTLAVHATPPTIGAAIDVVGLSTISVTSSTMTYPIAIPYYKSGDSTLGENVAKFRSYGWSRLPAGSGGGLAFGRAYHPSGFNAGACPSSVEFFIDDISFEMRFYTYYSTKLEFKLYVDDIPISATATSITGTTLGHAYLVPVTFATRDMRKIRIEFDRFNPFGGLIVNGSAFIVATGQDSRPQGYLITDSYGDGAGVTGPLDTYASQMARLINMDLWIDGQGGTGLVAPSGTGKTNYINRINPIVAETRLRPDVVFIQVSTNDGPDSTTASQVTAQLLACIASCRAMWPNAIIIVIGLMLPVQSGSLLSANVSNHINARNAANSVGTGAELFIDPFPNLTVAGQNSEGWYTGNSNTGSTGNTGNSGIYRMVEDNVHGTPAWHAMAAKKNASETLGYLAA